MLFHSYAFVFGFLPVVAAGFFLLARAGREVALAWLAAASLFFYGWWNAALVGLLLASIVANYAAGRALQRCRGAPAGRPLLALAIGGNLALLAYYKYAGFFAGILQGEAGSGWRVADVALPLGISFFTFTQVIYLVEVARGHVQDARFLHYLLFVSYFPHLIAGPLLHPGRTMPQFRDPATFAPRMDHLCAGMTVFALGLAKKVLLADPLAGVADPVFDAAAQGGAPSLLEAWAGALAYALQLYFDFSGYTDMAIGISLLFNVRLPRNFDSPYQASSIIEFWRRWHMTLSTFLRDYVYIPLGGNRRGPLRRHANLLATMLLGGLWHGANWTFVLWGGVHGALLVLNHAWRALRVPPLPGGRPLGVAATFLAVTMAWVVFRSVDLDTAGRMLAGMAGLNGLSLPAAWQVPMTFAGLRFEGAAPLSGVSMASATGWVAAGLVIVWTLPNAQAWVLDARSPAGGSGIRAWRPGLAHALVVGTLFAAAVAGFNRPSPFLYFQF